MKTISVSQLKAHLSSELKLVQEGVEVVVLDHRHPVAKIVPFDAASLYIREATVPYTFEPLEALTNHDPLQALDMERQISL